MKTYILADIHGEFDKLITCLSSVNFDYENDKLIQLGDVVDRGPDVYSCIEELLKIKNLIAIQGNHDECWLKSLLKGEHDQGLLWRHGAKETYQSYLDYGVNPEIHLGFFRNQVKYYIDTERRYFVHGGFNRHYPIDKQLDDTVYTWDRDLFAQALSYQNMTDEAKEYPFKIHGKPKEVFVGHTPTLHWGISIPIQAANIWNLDTGSGKGGLLTIMNLETKEYWQA
jgi:serine/threonine protein phosphatase 1